MSLHWPHKRVLVTGATGLVGSWLVKDLASKGARVTCLIRDWDPQSELIRSGTVNRVSVVSGGLESYATLERAIVEYDIETVFHLGAQTIVGSAHRSPLNTFESNIRGSYNLLEACRVHDACVVVASSDKAYGEVEQLPYDETMPPLGRHPYDVSKSCTDLIASAYAETYGLPVVTARCGNIYGGGDLNWSRLIPGTIRSLLQGERPIIRSDGQFRRDYIHVQDAVHAYLRMAQALEERPEEVSGQAFNFGPSNPLTVLEIVEKIRCATGRCDLEPEIRNEAQCEIRDQYLDSSKAKRLLGISPQVTLEEGLRQTVAWYAEFLAA